MRLLLNDRGRPMEVRNFLRSSRGSTAIEFSLVAPLLLLLVLGLIGFCVVLATASGLQQLAAEAARASVGGLTDPERTQIVRTFVAAHAGAYPFLDIRRLTVDTFALTSPPAFQVALSYDLTSGIVGILSGLMPGLPTHLQREAVVLISTGL